MPEALNGVLYHDMLINPTVVCHRWPFLTSALRNKSPDHYYSTEGPEETYNHLENHPFCHSYAHRQAARHGSWARRRSRSTIPHTLIRTCDQRIRTWEQRCESSCMVHLPPYVQEMLRSSLANSLFRYLARNPHCQHPRR